LVLPRKRAADGRVVSWRPRWGVRSGLGPADPAAGHAPGCSAKARCVAVFGKLST